MNPSPDPPQRRHSYEGCNLAARRIPTIEGRGSPGALSSGDRSAACRSFCTPLQAGKKLSGPGVYLTTEME
jgi:hypothetical protein